MNNQGAVAYDPELYALTHPGTPGDADYYVRSVRDGSLVLEAGCGWGRISHALAKAGQHVIAFDHDPAMIAMAEKRRDMLEGSMRERITLRRAAMETFDFSERFDAIIAPYTTLYCLAGSAARQAFLKRAHKHLRPGGRLIFDAYNAELFHQESNPEDYPDDLDSLVGEVTYGGVQLNVFERSSWNPQTQYLRVVYTYRSRDQIMVHEATIEHYYWTRAEVDLELAQAGLSLVEVLGDFEGHPYQIDSPHLVVVAERRDL